GHHHRRVGGVGARGDRGDRDDAVVDREVLALDPHRVRGTADDVLVLGGGAAGVVVRALAGRVGGGEGAGGVAAVAGGVVVPGVGGQHLAEGLLGVGEHDAVLRALRPGDRGDHGGQVQLEVLRVLGLLRRFVPQAL